MVSKLGNKDCVTRLHHLVTSWNSNEAFQAAEKSGFCGRELLPMACSLGFLTLQAVYMHKKLYNTPKEREKMEKHKRVLFNVLLIIKCTAQKATYYKVHLLLNIPEDI